ncbi:TniQ family protein [Vibrio sp. SCSIO 43140]|uniref:TniQ family protein n=1 Tax=Vibrio sp. SCSIO 43140 TaxID=2819100 RepID=UPI0020761289|nr:TniQ family protein [Vibrio sp. SCSIO 43140]USD58998.1 TniQ family protein [Vibrio sp. SCSIO 43140]
MDTNIELYSDESLESYLLRLSQHQGYERYSHFAEDIWYETLNSNEAIPGAFPLELNRVNIYHAQTTTQMRVRVLIQLEKRLKVNNYGVLRLALNHSKSGFSPDYKAVHRFGIDYPFAFLRKRFTPVCPLCLAEEPYIRQSWHFVPIQACEKHKCELIDRCPECKSLLEYQNTESITHCECGFDLRESEVKAAPNAELMTAKWLSGENSLEAGLMSKAMTISERFGVLLWYLNRYGDTDDISFDSFVDYCSAWPSSLEQELDSLVEKADVIRIKDWRKVFFSEAFGSVLKDCRHLPSRELSKNVVLTEMLNKLSKLVADNPASSKGNIADVLLSPLEASTLLSCTTDEVYRLYEFGEIKAAIRPRMHTKIASHESAFTLRSIVETKLTRMCSETDGLSVYLPEW